MAVMQFLYVSKMLQTEFGKIRAHIVNRNHIEFQTLGVYKFAVDKQRVEVNCHIMRRSTGWKVGIPRPIISQQAHRDHDDCYCCRFRMRDGTKASARVRNRIVKALIKTIEQWWPQILKSEYVRIERSNFRWQKHCLSRELHTLTETLARQANWLEECGDMVDVADQLRRQMLPIEELRARVRRQRFRPLSSTDLEYMPPRIAPPRPSLRLVEKRKAAA